MNTVFVIGAGAWGTALALAFDRAHLQTTLWSISLDEVNAINQRHENGLRLPGILLPPELKATTVAEDVSHADLVILVPPAQFLRNVCETFKQKIEPHVPLVIASKGIEQESCSLLSDVVSKYFPENPLLVLSGPSFATDVAKKLPTAVSLASSSLSFSQSIAKTLSSDHFILHPSDDIIGVQVGGACKNIIAIACGIVDGLQLGDNARAVMLTYGLDEIARLGQAMGGKLKTFMGLSGLGDLALTSLNAQSRNQSFGVALGQSMPLTQLLADKEKLTEGVHSVSGTIALAEKYNVNMPITSALHKFLNQSLSLTEFIDSIFSPPSKLEN